MKRFVSVIIGALFLTLLSFSLVSGAGSSAGSTATVVQDSPAPEPAREEAATIPVCDELSTTLERVRCRLLYPDQPETTPEFCRNVADSKGCVDLYDKVKPCYEKAGTEKDRCFKEVSGYSKTIVTADDKMRVRYYMLFLLYDLQERAEDSYAAGTINVDTAANAVTKTITVKQDLLNNKPKEDIQKGIADLKQFWKNGGIR